MSPRTQGAVRRIAAVARATGVSVHLLRIWERRYGELASLRSGGGYRLYSDQDVARIAALKAAVDAGYAIGDVVGLPPAELAALDRSRAAPRPPGPEAAASARRRFLEAIERLDLDEAGRALGDAAQLFSPCELGTAVIGPLLREIGDRWHGGSFSIAQEHASSAVIRSLLGELLLAAEIAPGGPTLVVTTPPGEPHELGALLAAVVAAAEGARVLYLGPNTPAVDAARAAVESGAKALLLSIMSLESRSVTRTIAAHRRALPAEAELWIGGAAVPEKKARGARHVATLGELRELVRSRTPAAGPRPDASPGSARPRRQVPPSGC